MNLFPVGFDEAINEENAIEHSQPTGYRESIFFDGIDFVRDGQNRIKASSGVEAWEQWCRKCLKTERYKSPLYPTDYGIEVDEAFHATTRELAESILQREITEALMADPYDRTDHIEDIAFVWEKSDCLYVHIIAVGIEDISIDFTTQLGGVI